MASKKSKETLELTQSSIFKLVAISTSLNINKLMWELNNACGFKLIKNSELELVVQFPVFTDNTSMQSVVISLISNKYQGKLLVKQLLNVDFILEFTGNLAAKDLKSYIQNVKSIPSVLAVIEVVPSSIKRKEPFCPE